MRSVSRINNDIAVAEFTSENNDCVVRVLKSYKRNSVVLNRCGVSGVMIDLAANMSYE